MRAVHLLLSLPLLVVASISDAQVPPRPDSATISPVIRERLEELGRRLRVYPDLVPVDLLGNGTCDLVAVQNVGLRPAIASEMRITVYEITPLPGGGYLQKAVNEKTLPTGALLPGHIDAVGGLVATGLVNDRTWRIEVAADAVDAVSPEVSETNNVLSMKCRSQN